MKTEMKRMKLTEGPAFKQFFMSNDQVLKAMLKSFLPIDEDISDIQFINPGNVESENKEARLDLNLLLGNKERVNVEMQMVSSNAILDRVVLDSMKSHDKLTTTYSLIFANFSVFEDEADDYYNKFVIRAKKDSSVSYNECWGLILVEMDRLNKKCSELVNLRDKLYYLLMHAHKLTPEERAHLSKTEEMKIAIECFDKMK